MIVTLKAFYRDVVRNKRYWMPVLLFSVLAYGFSIVNKTVSPDDLNMDYYIGSGNVMLSATRWGMVVWTKLLSIPVFMPFIRKFLMVCFFAAAAMVFCGMAYRSLACKSIWTYTTFSCAFVTYPLFTEIFEFDGANMAVGGNMLLVALVLFWLTDHFEKGPVPFWKKILLSSLPLTLVVSSYEAGAFFYVAAVCIWLFCKYIFIKKNEPAKCRWIRDGLVFALPLFVAIILRIVIGLAIIWLKGLSYAPNGETSVSTFLWFGSNFKGIVFEILSEIFTHYLLRGLVYFPLTIFAVATLIFGITNCVLAIRQKRFLPIVLGTVVFCSLFFLVFLRGGHPMLYRTAHTLGLFSAFVFAMLVEYGLRIPRRSVNAVILAGAMLLCLRQSNYTNKILSLNHVRSDNEIAVAQQLGYRIKSEFDEKPIVFVGKYDMGDWLLSQVSINPDALGPKIYNAIMDRWPATSWEDFYDDEDYAPTLSSYLTWSTIYSHTPCITNYFSYCGYDLQIMYEATGQDVERQNYYTQIAMDAGMKPFDIMDMGDYLLVSIGELEFFEE